MEETQEQIAERLERERMVLVRSVVAQAREQYEPATRDELTTAQAELYDKIGSTLSGVTEWRAMLAIIANGGSIFRDDDAEKAVDGFGAVLCNVAWLLAARRLAVGPVFDLARVLTKRGDTMPLEAASRLAMVALRRGNIGPAAYVEQLVEALAYVVAKCIDDTELVHELKIDVRQLLVHYVAGRHAADGFQMREAHMQYLNETCPETWDDLKRQRAKDIEEANKISDEALAWFRSHAPNAKPVKVPPAKVISIPPRHLQSSTVASAMLGLQQGAESLADAEHVEAPGDFDISDMIAHHNMCSQCGRVLSQVPGMDAYQCEAGHAISGQAYHARQRSK